MTTRSNPRRVPRSASSTTRCGSRRPPAWVTVRRCGQVHLREPDPVEQLEGVRHPGEGRDPCLAGEVPEARVGHGEVGEDDRGAGDEVAVHDAEAVAVVHGQARDGPVGGPDRQRGGDRLGVAAQVVPRQAHEARGAGRPARAQEEGEVGVQRGGRRGAVAHDGAVGVDRHVGVPGRGEGGGRVAGRGEEHRVAGRVRGEVADEGAERVRGVHVDEAALAGEQGCRVPHPRGEVGAGQRRERAVVEQVDRGSSGRREPCRASPQVARRGVRSTPPSQGRIPS